MGSEVILHPIYEPPTFIGVTSAVALGNIVDVPCHVDYQPGDHMLACVAYNYGPEDPGPSLTGVGAGVYWDTIADTTGDWDNNVISARVFWRFAGDSEPAVYTASTVVGTAIRCTIAVFRPAVETTLMEYAESRLSPGQALENVPHTAPILTPRGPMSMVTIFAATVAEATWEPPPDMLEWAWDHADISIAVWGNIFEQAEPVNKTGILYPYMADPVVMFTTTLTPAVDMR